MGDDFTDEERRALEAWKVDDAPDVSERVLAQLEEKPRRPFWIGVAVAAAMAAMVIGSVFIRRAPREGAHLAEQRTTASIGGRAVAVMEKGARLSYRAGVAIEVEQSAGNVFYRVDPGDAFVIRTPSGTVTVLGTCLRVEVKDMDAKVAGAIGAAAGALVAGTVLVTVYEGRVETISPEGGLILEAGEGAEMSHGRAPVKRKRVVDEDEPEVAAAALNDEEVKSLDPARLPERVLVLSQEKRVLEREVAALREQLEKAKGEKREPSVYDIPQEELLHMAEKCELRWDIPGIGGKQSMGPEDLEKLEVSQDEGEIINRMMAESTQHLLDETKKAYTAITGDENTGSMAGEAMFAEIRDKTTEPEMQRLYQMLARERAGLLPKSPEGAQMTPLERLYRAVTGEGDRLEQRIATELGPEAARRARDLHRGWGDRYKTSRGCPN